MDKNKPTQKKISQRYDGAADYPQRPHYLRRLRGRLFVGTVVASVLGALGFSYWGGEDAYSPGPISQNHATIAHDCRACHRDAEGVLPNLGKLISVSATLKDPGTVPAHSALARLDAACLQCHPTTKFHLPQAANVGLRAVSSELPVVHATGCATCHREHAGHGRMALPRSQTCVSCHNDASQLQQTAGSMKVEHTAIPASSANYDLGDGVIRFLTPARPPGTLPPFPSYAEGHPPFAYEQPGVRDSSALKYNHERHLRADIPQVNKRRLACTDCHQPGADSAFVQPVKYDQHCAPCHTLQFQPSLPKLLIPHGDPEKVRYFLAGRETSLELAVRAEGISDPAVLKPRVQAEIQALSRRGLNNLNDLEKRVFFEGDPVDRAGDRRMRSGNAKFLTECAKCHNVTPGDANRAPKVQPTNMPERWVQHGPFTHLPHQHMQCTDCHAAALSSTKTSDILMPSQKLCAECHRPPAATTNATAAPRNDPGALAAAQRVHGGVKWDCISCHGFHSPSNTPALLEALLKPAPARGGTPAK